MNESQKPVQFKKRYRWAMKFAELGMAGGVTKSGPRASKFLQAL